MRQQAAGATAARRRRLPPGCARCLPSWLLQFEQVLGRGAFKVVYKAFDTQEGEGGAQPQAFALLPPHRGSACGCWLLRSRRRRRPQGSPAPSPPPPPPPSLPPTPHPAGTEVAWNQVRVSELMSSKDAENKEERDRLFAEIRVLKALKHKNIMSFYDSWYDPKTYTVNFITELFTSGTLRQ